MSTINQFTILDTLFEAALVINSAGGIDYYNHHLSTLSKLSPRQLKQIKSINELFKNETKDIEELLEAATETQTPQLSTEIEISFHNSNEKCSVVLKISPLSAGKYLVLINDITIEKRLYDKYKIQLKELEQTHNQIIQADKLTTIGEMTANISHEISNPLTIASGNLEVIQALLESPELSEEEFELIKTSIADITEAHQRINTIMGNMKTFLHQSETKREYGDLGQLIDKTLSFLDSKLKDLSVEVERENSQTPSIALIDPIGLEQVFVNIIKNAMDSMAKVPSPKLTIKLSKSKNTLFIQFQDNGEGISKDCQDKIFNAFYTTKAIGEGTGLGLSISQKIIQSHQGELKLLDSRPGATIFEISLPCIEMMSYTQNEILQGRNIDKQTKRVLVVDDEVQILNLLNHMISDESMVFIGSANPYTALDMFDELPLDLIIVDYHMPEMSGHDFAKKIREKDQKIPILYMTGEDNKAKYHSDQEELSLSGLIEKPFTQESMLKSINQCLTKKER